MKNWILSAAACVSLCAGLIPAAQASVITLNTRYTTSGPLSSAADYKSTVDALLLAAPTSGYCDQTLSIYDGVSNQNSCGGSNGNIAFHTSVAFNVKSTEAGAWGFRFGVDFGRGGAVFLDGAALDFRTNDMWWSGSYADPTQSFQEYVGALSAGNHTLDVYGLEACCDGPQQGQFMAPAGSWTTFSARTNVPEPASLALLGLGLVGLTAGRRFRK